MFGHFIGSKVRWSERSDIYNVSISREAPLLCEIEVNIEAVM